ncbi:MAG: valine--tRNA ligase [Limnochorda sp.]
MATHGAQSKTTSGEEPLAANQTEAGPAAMPHRYDPRQAEERWTRWWEENRVFHARVDSDKPRFSMVIPPPNVTGVLHVGHALDQTLQDIFARWHRMQGKETLWLPGTDHAGIATQVRVEEELAKEGLSRHDLGREAFVERVWQWKHHYGGRILEQLKGLGASCDWERERFTMDEGCSRAVRHVFVHLYRKGLIYQGDYIVHWCPRCQTTLSDIEVEHEEEEGRLWTLRYPAAEGEGEIRVATTRPETMLGDTAVAVHPEDERYRAWIGRRVRLPLMDREIPVVADEAVDPAFGTGAVKVTPAHDPTDFEIGQRHNLPQIQVIGQDARMTAEAGRFQGLTREEARQAVLEALRAGGFLVGEEPLRHAPGRCYRCGTVVEPLVSRQWFVRMKPLAEPAIRAVEEGRVRFVPEHFTRMYLHWMRNVRDWCISRQLWWGHRIPVWTCQACGTQSASEEDLVRCPECGSERLEQDPDVLDTWFSSALWPFATLGWPDDTPDLRRFYPTDLLVTGYEIIFFWVARMIMMGIEFMGEPPFPTVLIHGIVRDSLGRKMSKSLGNGVDPMEVIAEYGADALRFSLVQGVGPGNDLRFRTDRVESARNFANKVWNASRFAILNLADADRAALEALAGSPDGLQAWKEREALTLADRWILSRYQWAASEVHRLLERFDPGEAAQVLYEFIWSDLCDAYIELVKPRLYQGGDDPESEAARQRRAAQATLFAVLDGSLRLLHPFMPYLTEEIWQRLPVHGPTLARAAWPRPQGLEDPEAEKQVGRVLEVIRAIRNLRAERGVEPSRRVTAVLRAEPALLEALQAMEREIRALARLERLELVAPGGAVPEREAAVTAVAGGVEIYLPLAGLVDLEKERARLEKELAAAREEAARARALLERPGFKEKAPAHVVQQQEARLAEAEAKEAKLLDQLAALERAGAGGNGAHGA